MMNYTGRVQVVRQRKDPVTITKTNRVMLSRKIITVYCESFMAKLQNCVGKMQSSGLLR